MTAPPLLDAVEASYAHAASDQQWLEGVIAAIAPSVDRGLGVAAYFVEIDAGAPRISGFACNFPIANVAALSGSMHADVSESEAASLYAPKSPVRLASAALGRRAFARKIGVREKMHPAGIHDVLNVVASDGSPSTVTISVPLPELGGSTRLERARLSRVAAHLAAGLRHRRLARAADPDAADAVVDPSGAVIHAASEASAPQVRSALRAQAVAIDRARSRLRRDDVDEALGLWRGLVAGRWSLVEHFESDGRRFYLARANPPAVRGLVALTERERCVVALAACGHSNKLIAYELGLQPASVSDILRVALAKLGVSGRTDLVRLRAAMGAADAPSRTEG